MSRSPGKKSSSKRADRPGGGRLNVLSDFRPEWIGWGFWALCVCVLATMVVSGMPGALIPALGAGLAYASTRAGVSERLRPYHPAYSVGTAMAIWLLWTVAATGNSDLLIDLGLLLFGLGFVSLLPGLISASTLSVILIAYAGVAWSHRGESTPDERRIITVEITLLLLTVAATWAGYLESQLKQVRQQRKRKKSSDQSIRKEMAEDADHFDQ
jgi:hypothetical protein